MLGKVFSYNTAVFPTQVVLFVLLNKTSPAWIKSTSDTELTGIRFAFLELHLHLDHFRPIFGTDFFFGIGVAFSVIDSVIVDALLLAFLRDGLFEIGHGFLFHG